MTETGRTPAFLFDMFEQDLRLAADMLSKVNDCAGAGDKAVEDVRVRLLELADVVKQEKERKS